MIEDDEVRKRADKLKRFGQKIERFTAWVEQRNKVVGLFLRRIQAWALWDFTHDVSHNILGLIALSMIVGSAISIDGWTKGNELRIALGGLLVLGLVAWAGWRRQRDLLLLYKIRHKGRTEWKNMVFDIRERYIHELHKKLNELYPGIDLYATYRRKNWEKEESRRATVKASGGATLSWENRSRVKIRSICYEWSSGENQVKLEYRQTPAQVYAARFLQTRGIGEDGHGQLKDLLEQEEWKIRPRFAWICRLGIGSVAVIVFVLTAAVFWGGPSAFFGTDIVTTLPDKAPVLIQMMITQTVLVIAMIIILVGLKSYLFPAGVFRIDEEKFAQERREKMQNWVLRVTLFALAAIIAQQMADFLNGVCESVGRNLENGENSIFVRYITSTNLCRIVEMARAVR